jgi:hypothetical protein
VVGVGKETAKDSVLLPETEGLVKKKKKKDLADSSGRGCS